MDAFATCYRRNYGEGFDWDVPTFYQQKTLIQTNPEFSRSGIIAVFRNLRNPKTPSTMFSMSVMEKAEGYWVAAGAHVDRTLRQDFKEITLEEAATQDEALVSIIHHNGCPALGWVWGGPKLGIVLMMDDDFQWGTYALGKPIEPETKEDV